jgi:hypothetical protein
MENSHLEEVGIHRPSADECMDYSHLEEVGIHRPSADECMDYSHLEEVGIRALRARIVLIIQMLGAAPSI